jgi:hypothetical protein
MKISKKGFIIAVIYLAITSFTIIGNPFAAVKTVTIPIFGILLTLPWSLVFPKLISSLTAELETGAVLNAIIILLLFMRRKT